MILSEKIRLENIRDVLKSKKYRFFTKGDFNLNIIGVRNSNRESDKFDDLMYIAYKSQDEWFLKEYPITTDPGRYWLEHPITKAGTAILVPGQYRGAWQLGKHRGKYEALVQRKPVLVYRDNNRDATIDMKGVYKESGLFGINIHRSSPYVKSYTVHKWSAGCQVYQKIADYNIFIKLCKTSAQIYGNSFTYTLINEVDLYKN
jgi:hypothetical protein